MKRNKKIVIIFIIFITSILIANHKYANDKIEIEKNTLTEEYKRWENLPQSEKKNYIQPLPFSVELETNNNQINNLYTRLRSSVLPTKYSLKNDIELVVRDQKNTGECWAFTTTNLISTNLQKTGKTKKFTLLSPRHMDYTTSLTFKDGRNNLGYNREVGDGGNCYLGLNYCTAGYGPILESQMPFVNNDRSQITLSNIKGKKVNNKIEEYIQMPSLYKKIVNNKIVYYNGNTNEYTNAQAQNIRNKIKEHIINYGAVSAYTYVNGTQYFDTNNITTMKNYYCDNDNIVPNHAITIVGWDDNYSASNFNRNKKPKNNGAYIVLNSHGSSLYNNGYMYVSYDDVLIERSVIGVTKSSSIDYNNIYQYDELGYSNSVVLSNGNKALNSAYMANVYNKKISLTNQKEYLKEISIYVPKKSSVIIYANVQNNNKSTLQQIENCGELDIGYHTIKLSNALEIKGKQFVVAAKYIAKDGIANIPMECNYKSNNMGSNFWDTAKGQAGQSFYSANGTSWNDLANTYKDSNFCIKAYTTIKKETTSKVTGITLNKEKIELKVGNSNTLVATINPTNDKNKNVTYVSSNAKVATVTNDGVVKAINTGATIITAKTTDGKFKATCNVKVIESDNNNDSDNDSINPTYNTTVTANNKVGVTYQAHVQDVGWQRWVSNEELSGTSGKSKRVEALKIKLENAPSNAKITYQAHVQDIGWQNWKSNGDLTGTSGKCKRVEGIKIKLENMPDYIIQYRVHVQNVGWQDWKSNGEMAGTSGKCLRIEGIQIRILKKTNIGVSYESHVQDIGWQKPVSNGALSGTSGKSKRVEALKIKLTNAPSNAPSNAKISYQAHVQDIGWQAWKSNGSLAGTSGKSKRVEGIRIKLENMPNYTIQYRVHVQNIGWQEWKADGEIAGTSGKSLRIEAIQIRIFEKRN